jgi:hypothetical protein
MGVGPAILEPDSDLWGWGGAAWHCTVQTALLGLELCYSALPHIIAMMLEARKCARACGNSPVHRQ